MSEPSRRSRSARARLRLLAFVFPMGVAAGVVLLFAGGTAQATPTCTINWTAAGSGNWGASANWTDPNTLAHRLPTTTDYACIPSSGITVTVNVSPTIKGLDSQATISQSANTLALTDNTQPSEMHANYTLGGTLGGAGQLTVDGVMTWNGGAINGTGTLIIAAATGQLTMNPATCCSDLTIGNGRTVTNNGAATLTIPSGTSGYGLSLCSGASTTTFNNNGTFTYVGDNTGGAQISDCGTKGYFHNTGTFTKTAGTNTDHVYAAFDNDGTVNVQSGVLSLQAGGGTAQSATGVFSGGVSLDSGTFDISNPAQFNNGAAINGGTV